MHRLRYRQIHLDFHTSPAIPGIGAGFDAEQFKAALRRGHVDSITCFAVGHHGWSYNDTRVGERHPHLAFDLLRAQFDAAKSMDVNVPIYITAGINNRVAEAHPEWREITAQGAYGGMGNPLVPGFRKLCFNTPYLDHVCDLIREAVHDYPDCDGIFLDIISQGPCCCEHCLASMHERGYDPTCDTDRFRHARDVLMTYYRRTTEAAQSGNPDMPVFHNSGHIQRGDREILPYFSHLELESLPTGGWGYDHFPLSAKYCTQLEHDFLGMTGKFHTTWGEFGGYKHPNALRYECAAMVAFGAKCSVGDQLHPSGVMDETTYDLIGQAYAEVEQKEPWCVGARPVADIGLLSSTAVENAFGRNDAADEGAARILLEGHFLFDVLDKDMDFPPYKVLVLPDSIRIGTELQHKLDAYLAGGGQLFLTGESGLRADGSGFAFDIGATWEGESGFCPDFVRPAPEVCPGYIGSPMVMYLPSQRIRATHGTSLGQVYDPYFNRTYRHFCSHQHTPPRPEPSGYDAGVSTPAITYLAHPVFSIYRGFGAVPCRDYITRALRARLGEALTLRTNLPSTARVSLTHQAAESRSVLHLLFASTVSRGGSLPLSAGAVQRHGQAVEVIEELLPLRDIEVAVALPATVTRATLEPQGVEVPIHRENGRVTVTVPEFTCHQMVVFSSNP